MYVIKNINNDMYIRTKIEKGWWHIVRNLKEARKFRSKIVAREVINSLVKPENYEILKLNKKGDIVKC